MALHIESPKDAAKNLLDLINEFRKVVGYKINTPKSVAFLYTNNERSEIEIHETIPFNTASKRPGISLPNKRPTLQKL